MVRAFRKLGFALGLAEPDCGSARDSASDLVDGEMSPRRARLMRRHLERCGPCRRFAESLRRTVALVRALPRRRAPRGWLRGVRERLG